jgi:hypothetical protein
MFSFLLQVCLTTFVFMQVINNFINDTDEVDDLLRYGLWVLASLGSLYSFLIAIPEVRSTIEAVQILYKGRFSLLMAIDVIVNIFIPSILVVIGFLVVIQDREGFINAVLNTAALLFIPEIDDKLPALLGYEEKAIVEDFLIGEAKRQYDYYANCQDSEIFPLIIRDRLGVQFNDFFVTNSLERGRSHQDFALYQPYIVRPNKVNKRSNEIDPSNFITEDCLLKKIEWKFTHWNKDDTTKPRVGYLKLHKLNGQIVEIKYDKEDVPVQDKLYSTQEGTYIITNIVLSSAILKLRFCGSNSAGAFKHAMEYYSLWQMTYGAKALLRKHTNSPFFGDKFVDNPLDSSSSYGA